MVPQGRSAGRRRRAAAAFFAASALVFGTVACSGDGEDTGNGDATEFMPAGDGRSSYPLKITTSVGTAELEQRPERVVTFGGVSTEVALSLGIVPVASDDWTTYSSHLEDDGAARIPQIIDPVESGAPTEAIAEADPDLIVYFSWKDQGRDFDQLSSIAPVIVYDSTDVDWRTQVRDLALATDLGDAGDAALQKNDTAMAGIRDEHPEWKGKTAEFISDKGGGIYFESYGGSTGEKFFHSLGFTSPEVAGKYNSSNSGTKNQISTENIGELDADIIFVYCSKGMPTLSASSTFQGFEAVKKGLVFPMEYDDPDNKEPVSVAVGLRQPGPLTEVWLAEYFERLLGDKVAV